MRAHGTLLLLFSLSSQTHAHKYISLWWNWCESDLSDHSWIQRVSNKKLSYDGDTSKDIRESKNIGIWDCCVNILNRNINQRFLIKNAESENVCTKMKFFDLNASNHGESLIFNQHCIRTIYTICNHCYSRYEYFHCFNNYVAQAQNEKLIRLNKNSHPLLSFLFMLSHIFN